MTKRDFEDIVGWGAEETPRKVSLQEVKRELKNLVPALIGLKTRKGSIRQTLDRLALRMQTLCNAKYLADAMVKQAHKVLSTQEEEVSRLNNILHVVGCKLPADIGESVTITLSGDEARQLKLDSSELIIRHGEADMSKPASVAAGLDVSREDNLFGKNLASMFSKGFINTWPAISSVRVKAVRSKKNELKLQVEKELLHQGMEPKGLTVTELDGTLVVSVDELVPLHAKALLDKDALRRLFKMIVPAGVAVESELL